MALQDELEELCTLYEQALEIAMKEKTAWEAVQMSYGSLTDSYKSMGKSHEEAQAMFDGMMQDYADRYAAALGEIHRTSDLLRIFLRQHSHSVLMGPRIKSRLGRP